MCILKMDHHCPWLNGCVGHFNHRYFFLYMTYTVIGCIFLMVFGFEILWDEVFPAIDGDQQAQNSTPPHVNGTSELDEEVEEEPFYLFSRHNLIMYETFIVTGCFVVLGGLTLWHAKLITLGETSIEAHINRAETRRLKAIGQCYRNPYDFSPWHNWCLFLGMLDGRGWSSVLWPSAQPPKGDGLMWDSVYSCDVRWNNRFVPQQDPAKLA